jgi:ABC-type long-subunit fatty acid transport system fused permease/ATPase subunit
LGGLIGLPPAAPDAAPIIGAAVFVSAPFIWFYIYFIKLAFKLVDIDICIANEFGLCVDMIYVYEVVLFLAVAVC